MILTENPSPTADAPNPSMELPVDNLGPRDSGLVILWVAPPATSTLTRPSQFTLLRSSAWELSPLLYPDTASPRPTKHRARRPSGAECPSSLLTLRPARQSGVALSTVPALERHDRPHRKLCGHHFRVGCLRLFSCSTLNALVHFLPAAGMNLQILRRRVRFPRLRRDIVP